MHQRPFPLRSILVGDRPESWAAAGFAIESGTIDIARTTVALVGTDRGRGILSVVVDGIDGEIDGLAFRASDPGPASEPAGRPGPGAHPNGVVALDHLVAMSPDMDRTTAALTAAGLEHRRTRTFAVDGGTRRQAFFWLGDVILELVGDDVAHGDGPALFWGLALTCDDLEHAARHLGDRLGAVKPAVQAGRQIATMRTRPLDVSVPIALMSAHAGDRS